MVIQERKGSYLDMIKGKFIALAAGHGVAEDVASELSMFMAEQMMKSWQNGLRTARGGAHTAPATV